MLLKQNNNSGSVDKRNQASPQAPASFVVVHVGTHNVSRLAINRFKLFVSQ
jgi:hypothetical protein